MPATSAPAKPKSAPPSKAASSAGSERTVADGELLQLVTFVVGSEEFAIPILCVQEINRLMEITRVPQSPEFIEGVVNLRGKIVPVMELRKRFGLEKAENSNDCRIIVIEVSKRVIGFTVDRVNEVLRVSSGIVDPPPPMVCGIDSDYVQGVGKLDDRLLILLNLEKLFSNEDLKLVDQATEAAGA